MSSSSSSVTGTDSKSAVSTGSVTSPKSAAPDRRSAMDRSPLPTVTFKSRLCAPDFGEQRGKYVKAYGHPTDETDRATQRFPRVADRGYRVLQILEDAVAEPEQRFSAGVIRMRRPIRWKTGSPSSASRSSTWRLIADCETCSFSPAAVNEPLSAIARMISSCRRSMRLAASRHVSRNV